MVVNDNFFCVNYLVSHLSPLSNMDPGSSRGLAHRPRFWSPQEYICVSFASVDVCSCEKTSEMVLNRHIITLGSGHFGPLNNPLLRCLGLLVLAYTFLKILVQAFGGSSVVLYDFRRNKDSPKYFVHC